MEAEKGRDADGPRADHLCVLVHGLWGNPSHLDYVASALRERHGDDRLYILAVQRNSGSYTYDGIELGGERVAYEIEDTLERLTARGCQIKKLSVVGYSLGGLVARYAVGLLQANGWLDKLEPVNFTTFVSPHVGVRSPIKGFPNHIWNVLGARTVSTSGRQLFLIDQFRETGKPLLSVLADPDSIFMRGLARFKHRSVYGNIMNDRSTVFYTTGISKVNPFTDPENTNFNYVKGYEPVVIDPHVYTLPSIKDSSDEQPSFITSATRRFHAFFSKLPFLLFLVVFVPIGSVLFLLNSVVQNFRSQKRIKLHEQGKAGVFLGRYRVPLIVQDVRGAVEDVFEHVNASQDAEYLSERDEEYINRARQQQRRRMSRQKSLKEKHMEDTGSTTADVDEDMNLPLLALTPAQFEIIDALNSIGFTKYPVYIHNVRHSHAAIIVRMPRESFSEGKVVVKHWLDQEFRV